jgi:hypothetical protein
MSPGAKLPSLSAALAGVPAGVQRLGPWAGRRQLSVRFADEAETATIYTAAGLCSEIARLTARSRYHSITIAGRDPLGEVEFLDVAFAGARALPVMLDHDGQRPDALAGLLRRLDLVQVRLDGTEREGTLERAIETLRRAGDAKVSHALVIVPADGVTDAQLLRVVTEAHGASEGVAVLLHPSVESDRAQGRRWTVWLEQASAVHGDVRLLPVAVTAPRL